MGGFSQNSSGFCWNPPAHRYPSSASPTAWPANNPWLTKTRRGILAIVMAPRSSLTGRDNGCHTGSIVTWISIAWVLNGGAAYYPVCCGGEITNAGDGYIDYKGGQEASRRDSWPTIDAGNLLARSSATPVTGVGVRERVIRQTIWQFVCDKYWTCCCSGAHVVHHYGK